MKIKIKQNILLDSLNNSIRGISNKNLIPILHCIKFDLTKEGLYLESTDNEIAIKTFINKNLIDEIEETGSFVVSGKYIYEIIKKLPNTIINIEEAVDSKLSIYTDNSSFNLNLNNLHDFPQLDLDQIKNPIVLKNEVLKTLVNQTAFATSTQESRPVLTGINFVVEDDVLEFIATDSYRLSKRKLKLKENVEEKINMIIPTKNILELTRMLNTEDGDVEIHTFSNKVIFKFDNIIMMSRLISGTYPDVSKLIPNSFSLILDVNYNDIYRAIDRASLLTNESDKNTIKFETTDLEAKIFSNIPEIGNVEENININKNNNDNIKIAFSSKYMLEALKAIDSENIELLFNGEIKPIIVKNKDDDSLTQLILPIRTY